MSGRIKSGEPGLVIDLCTSRIVTVELVPELEDPRPPLRWKPAAGLGGSPGEGFSLTLPEPRRTTKCR